MKNGPAMLEGRVALVTGGARGIGWEISRTLIAHGAKVLVVDNGVSIGGDDPDPACVAEAVARLGQGATACVRDIGVAGEGAAAVAEAVERFGALDIVVNNAAILRDALVFKLRRAEWERVLAVNLMGPIEILGAASAVLREQAKSGRSPGRIVNIVSSAGLIGNFGQTAYASAKAGLVGATRIAAMDLARSGISCNAVAPFAATRVTESIQPANEAQASYKQRALRVPAGHVARVVSFLVSDANTFTGQIFGVRGREVFLFGQPRPVARIVAESAEQQDVLALGGVMEAAFTEHITSLATDLELFDTEPLP